MKYLNVTVEVFCILGRVGGRSPGVTGAASERPLERVVSNEVRARGLGPEFITYSSPLIKTANAPV